MNKGPTRKDIDKEQAVADCIKYRTPTPGVDHSNHYKKIEVLMGIKEDKEKPND